MRANIARKEAAAGLYADTIFLMCLYLLLLFSLLLLVSSFMFDYCLFIFCILVFHCWSSTIFLNPYRGSDTSRRQKACYMGNWCPRRPSSGWQIACWRTQKGNINISAIHPHTHILLLNISRDWLVLLFILYSTSCGINYCFMPITLSTLITKVERPLLQTKYCL
jgi:hypothetical protein